MNQLGLAAAYFLLGRASLLLAIPPGYAAPVWPAAGLALAAFLLRGDRMWVGVFLGHFLVNQSTSGADATSVLLSVVIAAGGTLQALAGARLVRHSPGFPNALGRGEDIVKFMLLAGPVACLTSPTLGVLSLAALGKVTAGELPFSWATWWVGDVLGVLLVTPALLLWNLPRPASRTNRAFFITAPLAVTLAGAVAAFVFTRDHETHSVADRFHIDAATQHHLIEKEADVYIESLRSLRYFFNSSQNVDRAEFRTFTERPLARHEGFLALSWDAAVPSARRAAFEGEVRREGFPDFRVTEFGPGGALRPAGPRPEHVPITYIEPLAENRLALGFDVASDPVRRAVFDRACAMGEPAVSGRLDLVQTRLSGIYGTSAGFLIALPVFTHGPRPADERERRQRLTGYVVGVLALDRLVERALKNQRHRGISLTVIDEDGPGGGDVLYASADAPANPSLTHSMDFHLPGRKWKATYGLSAAAYAERRSPTPWLTLIGVMLFALVLAVFLLLVTGHAETVEAEVRDRTSEIDRQKTLLRSIIDNMGEGVAVADAAGRFLLFNTAAERIVGAAATQGGPGEWSSSFGVFHPDAVTPLPTEQNPLARSLRGELADDVELFIRNPRVPEGVFITVTSRPLNGPDGAPMGGVAVFRDVTARRRTADELRRAKAAAEAAGEAKAAFLANMSHEIRTPMNAVVGMAGLLEGTKLDAEQHDFVRTLRSAADGLLVIVNDILDFSRFEAGKVPLEERDFDLRAIVHDALRILDPQSSAKNLDLAFFCDPSVPARVRGDGNRLRQVLLNLVGNAVKFTAEGGVSVEARRWGSREDDVEIRFTVRDTGIGIPLDVQSALFTPFVQAEASTTRRFGGTGLGLAISKKIIEAMGGHIELKSRPDEGAEFGFSVHLKPAAEGLGATLAPTRPRDLKVLFVDDNHVNRLILSQQLASWEMEAYPASSAADCWSQLLAAHEAGRPFSLALIDLRMPDEDGLSLARRIKADPDLQGIPLVLCASATNAAPAPEFAARVQKPVNPSALFNAIVTALGAPAGVAAPADEATVSARTFEHLRVLLVDDNATNVKVGTLQLKRLGVVPDVAADGEQALAALLATRYDVVFLDCQMPVMDGFTAVRKLRDREAPGKRTPVVAMTANALEGDRESCLAAGMDDYLSKPVSLEDLAGALARWDTPLDPAVLADLRELAEGTPELLREILTTFAKDAPDTMKAIGSAVDGGDGPALKEAAHKLKGAAGTVGARKARYWATLLEAAGAAGDFSGAPAAFARLEAAVAETAEAISSMRAP